jgi:NAD(P)-dependent dehydrogenase (short-subunit alcohol dehydrogenase family)
MKQRLEGRTALVTGATSGIGKAVTIALAAEGAQVVLSGRDAERGVEVVATIVAAGGKADFIAADLAAGGVAITELADRAVAALGGRLDLLVNNAAQLVGGLATTDTPEELVDRALAVSVKAPFLLTAAIVPAMVDRGEGVIVNLGSINGIVGMTGAALYGSTKHAIHGLTKAWAAEFGPSGVRVNTVAPGPTLTDTVKAMTELRAQIAATVPSRKLSTPEDVAAAVVFLASDDAANIHGATLSVDGGFTAL